VGRRHGQTARTVAPPSLTSVGVSGPSISRSSPEVVDDTIAGDQDELTRVVGQRPVVVSVEAPSLRLSLFACGLGSTKGRVKGWFWSQVIIISLMLKVTLLGWGAPCAARGRPLGEARTVIPAVSGRLAPAKPGADSCVRFPLARPILRGGCGRRRLRERQAR
jgi:hypothetical protein